MGVLPESPERFGSSGGEQIPNFARYFTKGRTKAQLV